MYDIVHSLKQLGPTALLYKIDISRAFRHIRIDPGDLDFLGLKHGDYYIDGTLLFGFQHGSVFFQRCTDAVRYIMKKSSIIRTHTIILIISSILIYLLRYTPLSAPLWLY